MIAYFKNRFLPEDQCHISIHDRSFRFGDGVFDTCLVVGGRIYDFAAHLARLKVGLAACRIVLDTDNIEALCRELIAKNGLKNGYVRMFVSRGEGPVAVGYAPGKLTPYLLIQTSERAYPAFSEVKLFVSSYPAATPLKSKSNSSLPLVLAMMEAQAEGCDNALLLDSAGRICETASGNIFWVTDGVLYTPATDLPMVPGTMRAKVMSLWDGSVQEGHYTLEALKKADEIFMTNVAYLLASVIAVVPIGIALLAGPHSAALREKLDRDISAEIAGN